MAIQQSDLAVSYANQAAAFVQQMHNLRQAIVEFMTINSNTPLGNLWNALNTVSVNSDGSLATTNDSTINNAHPISPVSYPAISRAMPANTLANALTLFNNFDAIMAGTAVSSNGSAPATIDTLAM